MRLSISLGLVVAGAFTTPAAALPPLTFDQPCYGEGMPIQVRGTGFTPNAPVDLIGGAGGKLGRFELMSGAGGQLDARLRAPAADDFLGSDRDERRVVLEFGATDRTRAADDQPDPESEFAPGRFTLSRLGVDLMYPVTAPRLRPGGRFAVEAYGWAHVTGKALYLHYVRGDRVVKATRLGVVRGECGDLTMSYRRFFPFRAKPGLYHLIIGPRADLDDPDAIVWRSRFRVRRSDVTR